MEKEKEEQFFTETKNKIQEYLQDRLLLGRLRAAEKISKLAAAAFSTLLVAVLFFFILLFLSIMAGYFFAAVTGSLYLGFGIVAAFYLILLLVVLKVRILDKVITNKVISIIFDQNAEKEEEDASEQK